MLEELDGKIWEAYMAYLQKNDELAGELYEDALMDLFALKNNNCNLDVLRNRILVVRNGLEMFYYSKLISDTGFGDGRGYFAFEKLLKQEDNPHVKKYNERMAELRKTLEYLEKRSATQG